MDEEDRKRLRDRCETVLVDVQFLIDGVDELPDEASDEEVNMMLASRIWDIEKHIRHIREERTNDLKF